MAKTERKTKKFKALLARAAYSAGKFFVTSGYNA